MYSQLVIVLSVLVAKITSPNSAGIVASIYCSIYVVKKMLSFVNLNDNFVVYDFAKPSRSRVELQFRHLKMLCTVSTDGALHFDQILLICIKSIDSGGKIIFVKMSSPEDTSDGKICLSDVSISVDGAVMILYLPFGHSLIFFKLYPQLFFTWSISVPHTINLMVIYYHLYYQW